MGDFLVWLLDKYSGWVIAFIVAAYLLLEFVLDIVHDLFLDWLRGALEKRQLGRLFSKNANSTKPDRTSNSDSSNGSS